MQDRRGHHEELRADIDDASQDRLPSFEARTEPDHRIEGGAGEPAGRTLDVPQVLRERIQDKMQAHVH